MFSVREHVCRVHNNRAQLLFTNVKNFARGAAGENKMSATNPASIPKNERLTEASEATANGDEEFGDFQIRPSLLQSFQRADVRAIIVDVFQQVLDGEYIRS